MEISYYSAIWMVLLTSFMWGFWHQFVKKISPWPLPAFMIWMYTSGTVIVWACVLAFRRALVPEGIMTAILSAPGFAALAMLCGAGFAIGMQIQLYVVSKMGLIYSTSIVSSSAIILGTVLSSILGGIPKDTSFAKILFGAVILLTATLSCQWASREKDRFKKVSAETVKKNSRKYALILLCYLLFFSQSYTIGMSASVRTDLRPNGLPGPVAVGMLAIGASLTTILICGAMLIRSGKLKTLFHPEKKICLLYAVTGGLCCLGGDLLHNIASPVISVAIAWPLSNLSGVWQYFWGIVTGEFIGSGRKAKKLLAAGMGLFVIGVVWLTFARYGH
jgi:hypothetical protein